MNSSRARSALARLALSRLAVGRLALLLGGLAVAGLLMELAFRVAWTMPWYERLHEQQTRQDLATYAVGDLALPLRRAPRAEPKPAGTTRVLFLGDSFTYGVGIGEEETFVARVAAQLTEARPEGHTFEVFNGGIPASMTAHWRLLFADFQGAFAPDLVVAVFFLRDGVLGVRSSEQIAGIRERMRELSQSSLLYQRLFLYRYFWARRVQSELGRSYLIAIEDGYLGPPRYREEWIRAQANLRWIRDQSLEAGARFALVIFPVLFELGDDYPLRRVCDEIEAFAVREGMPVLSLLPAFAGERAADLWLSPFDQHPNERAHEIVAGPIYTLVESLIAPLVESPVAEARAD